VCSLRDCMPPRQVGFYVQPEAGPVGGGEGAADGSDDTDRPYRLAGGDEARYEQHDSFAVMGFHTSDRDAVGRLIRSLLRV
jgi:hypothetical protein